MIKSALWTVNPNVMAKGCFVKPLFYSVSFQLGSHSCILSKRKSCITTRANCSAAFLRNKSNHTHTHTHKAMLYKSHEVVLTLGSTTLKGKMQVRSGHVALWTSQSCCLPHRLPQSQVPWYGVGGGGGVTRHLWAGQIPQQTQLELDWGTGVLWWGEPSHDASALFSHLALLLAMHECGPHVQQRKGVHDLHYSASAMY